MRLEIVNDASNKTIIGYLEQVKYPELNFTPTSFPDRISNLEYIYPTLNRHLVINNNIGEMDLFIPSNTRYNIITTAVAPVIDITYTHTDATTTTVSVSGEPLFGTNFYMADITTPENIFSANLTLEYANSETIFYMYMPNLAYKLSTEEYMYGYVTRSPIDRGSDVFFYDIAGNTYGSNYFDYERLDNGLLSIKSDIAHSTELYVKFDSGSILNYTETIDPSPISTMTLNTSYVEYAEPINPQGLFLIGDSGIYQTMFLCGRNTPVVKNDSTLSFTYSLYDEPTNAYTKNGAKILKYSKIIKEKATIINTTQIQTKLPIRTQYIPQAIEGTTNLDGQTPTFRYVPTQVFDDTLPRANGYGCAIGVSVFINGLLMNNSHILYLHEDEGIIELDMAIDNADIAITYTTDEFINFGTLEDIGLNTTGHIVSSPSNIYKMHNTSINDVIIYTDETQTTMYSSTNVTDDNDTGVYSIRYDITDTGYIYYGTIDTDYIGYIVTYSGTGTATLNGVSRSLSSATITSVVYHETTDTSAEYILELINTSDLRVYNIQTFGVSNATGNLYFVPNLSAYGYNSFNIRTGNYELIDNSAYIKEWANLRFVSENVDSLFSFIYLNKRGGGLAPDDIIEATTGYERRVLLPASSEYGDICNAKNRHFIPQKFIVIKLPLSIIDNLITQMHRVEIGKTYYQLYTEALKLVYNKIRQQMPAGAYFKIYTEANEPWPLETE